MSLRAAAHAAARSARTTGHLRALLASCGVAPPATSCTDQARQLVDQHGACIITAPSSTKPGALPEPSALASARCKAVFGQSLLACPDAIAIDSTYFIAGDADFVVHSDASGFGDHIPDYVAMTCESAAATGGESFLVDSYAVLRELAADERTAWLPTALMSVDVDTRGHEGTGRGSVRRVVAQTPAGRLSVCRPAANDVYLPEKTMKPLAERDSEEQDWLMLEHFHAACDAAAAAAPRFKLLPSQTLVIDNYRTMHGREPFEGSTRKLWRNWMWTTAGSGLPPGGDVQASFVGQELDHNGVRQVGTGHAERPKI